jgi:hypothetical protein
MLKLLDDVVGSGILTTRLANPGKPHILIHHPAALSGV